MPAVSLIIVNWNGKNFLADCLDGLRQQTYGSFTVILVDNGSVDGSLELVHRRYPEVETIPLTKNMGFAAANNIAIRSVNTEYVALLNNDAFPHPQWLEKLTGGIEECPEAGSAASKMLFYSNRNIIDRAGDAYTVAGSGQLRGRRAPAEKYNMRERIFGACAGAALYRTEMLRDIGLFDEDFFLLYEDVDLSLRAQHSGLQMHICPGSRRLSRR